MGFQKSLLRLWLRLVALAVVFGLSVGAACKRSGVSTTAKAPERPTIRLYVLGTVAGAIEPCGCQKDMLGGVDHAAAFMDAQAKNAPHSLVIGAGPMLFMDPVLEGGRKQQDIWKAEAMARAFGEMGVVGWAPGANDFADGPDRLRKLAEEAKAALIAANLGGAGFVPARVVEVDGYRIGITGVAAPRSPAGAPANVAIEPLDRGLSRGLEELKRQKAQIQVALVAAERGEALRLAERIPGFDVMVVGKPFDRGEGNDAPTPPVLVDGTLVVQPPNHLQAMAVVDLYVREGFDFQDASGTEQDEKRQSLESRIHDIEQRLAEWETSGASKADLDARKSDLHRMRRELASLRKNTAPPKGSFFRYDLTLVRERLGSEQSVAARLSDYYRRVNDYNREAFKDDLPPALAKGESGYTGADECSNCHDEEYAFWKTTQHFKAYETLSSQHKEFNLDCVSCHVTGYEKPGGSTVTHVEKLRAVQCETCHGPGSRHEDDPKNPAWIIAKPAKTICQNCHHPPHVREDWNADRAWPHIIGPGHGK